MRQSYKSIEVSSTEKMSAAPTPVDAEHDPVVDPDADVMPEMDVNAEPQSRGDVTYASTSRTASLVITEPALLEHLHMPD